MIFIIDYKHNIFDYEQLLVTLDWYKPFQTKFHKAKGNVSEKQWKDTANRDNKTINGLLESMIHLVGLLNISYQGIQDFSKLVPNIITEDILDVSSHSLKQNIFLTFWNIAQVIPDTNYQTSNLFTHLPIGPEEASHNNFKKKLINRGLIMYIYLKLFVERRN